MYICIYCFCGVIKLWTPVALNGHLLLTLSLSYEHYRELLYRNAIVTAEKWELVVNGALAHWVCRQPWLKYTNTIFLLKQYINNQVILMLNSSVLQQITLTVPTTMFFPPRIAVFITNRKIPSKVLIEKNNAYLGLQFHNFFS